MKARVAAGRDVDHGGYVEFNQLFVNRIPIAISQWRRCPVAARWIRAQVAADKAKFVDGAFQFLNRASQRFTGDLR